MALNFLLRRRITKPASISTVHISRKHWNTLKQHGVIVITPKQAAGIANKEIVRVQPYYGKPTCWTLAFINRNSARGITLSKKIPF